MMAMVRIETFLGMPEARLILQGARVYLCCLIGAAGLKTLDLLDRDLVEEQDYAPFGGPVCCAA